MSSPPFLIEAVLTMLFPKKNTYVTDVGCGIGKWGLLLRMQFPYHELYILGVDISKKNLLIAKKTQAYDDLIIADARQLPFRDSILDYAMACEIIEHVDKGSGIKIISELERVTNIKILLTTPYAKWWHEDEAAKAVGHITRYQPGELRKIGFKVHGIGLNLRAKGKLFHVIKNFILKPLVYVIPEMGEFLVATKSPKTIKK